jgi:hypothetical protein
VTGFLECVSANVAVTPIRLNVSTGIGFALYVEIVLERSCDVGNPGEYNCIVY